ncbi:hypothetical protein JL720_5917 [Aureococcus anophagefferens]|nr:hypothetical protein JL720_5917 [Aureococcus anophagefferens]
MPSMLTNLGCAGSAAVITVTGIHPIDTVKTRLQAFSPGNAKKSNPVALGLTAFWKGIGAAWMREASYTSFRLGLYKPLKQLFKADKPDAESGDLDYLRTDCDRETTKTLFIDVSRRPDSPFILKFAAGGASGGLGSVVGNPFDILKTKMMASETGLGLAETAGSIFANQGVLGFYRGIDANIARAVVNNGTKMACYDQSKGLLQEHVGLSGIGLQAAASFVAGFFMTCTVAPFDICRTRLMNQRRHRREVGVSRQKSIGVLFPGPADGAKVYNNIADTFVKIATKEGPLTLWAGFIPMWARIAPTTTFQLLFFEYFSKLAGISAT